MRVRIKGSKDSKKRGKRRSIQGGARHTGGTNPRSVGGWLKKVIEGPAYKTDYQNLAHQLAERCARAAAAGDIRFFELLMKTTEPVGINEQELEAEVERVFNIVTRHIKDQDVLRAIAEDLEKETMDDGN